MGCTWQEAWPIQLWEKGMGSGLSGRLVWLSAARQRGPGDDLDAGTPYHPSTTQEENEAQRD